MVSHGNDIYLSLRTLRRSFGCSFSLLICVEAIVSSQERGDSKDNGTRLETETNITEGKTDKIRADRQF